MKERFNMKAHRHSMRMKHKKQTNAAPKTNSKKAEKPDGLAKR